MRILCWPWLLRHPQPWSSCVQPAQHSTAQHSTLQHGGTSLPPAPFPRRNSRYTVVLLLTSPQHFPFPCPYASFVSKVLSLISKTQPQTQPAVQLLGHTDLWSNPPWCPTCLAVALTNLQWELDSWSTGWFPLFPFKLWAKNVANLYHQGLTQTLPSLIRQQQLLLEPLHLQSSKLCTGAAEFTEVWSPSSSITAVHSWCLQ